LVRRKAQRMRGSGQKEKEDVEEGFLALRVKRRIWTVIVRRASFAWTAKRQKRKTANKTKKGKIWLCQCQVYGMMTLFC